MQISLAFGQKRNELALIETSMDLYLILIFYRPNNKLLN